MSKMNSPCLTCTRVKNPQDCENKNCGDWRRWFIARWEATRKLPRLQKELSVPLPDTIAVGGVQYRHPDSYRDFIGKDPCDSCEFPKDLCKGPCPEKRAWEIETGGI